MPPSIASSRAAAIILTAVGLVAVLSPAAPARERRAVQPPPAAEHVLPEPGALPGPACGPCVHYANSPCCPPCVPLTTRVLTVCDPCTGCPLAVEVCVPECAGEPCVSGRNTLFGNGLVRFEWCGGYEVVIRFTRCGDLKVIYH
jgi:hypothetical protein